MKIPSATEMQLLALVSACERSGREVAALYEDETGSKISYGTLYTTFRRLKDFGWVEARDDEDEDGRVRFFQTTGLGRQALDEARSYYQSLSVFGLSEGRAA